METEAEVSARDDDAADLLEQTGTKVRQLRSRRGMSRRDLSEHARISERYLGQLEKGRANVTLGLLHRIAGALNEPLTAFLPAGDEPARIIAPLRDLLAAMTEAEQTAAFRLLTAEFERLRGASHGVALIGMRGAGKTTLGRRLAEACGVPFIRISDVIQEIGGTDIGELVEMTGQNAYRRLEHQALEHVVRFEPTAVVEAGGGLVSEPHTFGLLTRHFQTVWIRATPEEHMQRVIDQGDLRPMADNREAMDDLKAILRERDPFYRQADHILDTSRRTPDDCLAELTAICSAALAV